ncbi:MAG TPA: class I SAM-dependent methyltransferase [Afifellaceae bacterium]|nr:class I SAM-dependent methyltransferase [Afifellaceae bacterium]
MLRRLYARLKPVVRKPPPIWEVAARRASDDGTQFSQECGEGFTLGRYEKDGAHDYNTYRAIQEIGNRAKVESIFTTPEVIGAVAEHAIRKLRDVKRVLCHGTRNGAEQSWFKANCPDAVVLGTDISTTATQFPMTICWDFHDLREDWLGSWDVIYSNSWDHSYSPDKMFDAWARSLRGGGLLYLEHTREHERVDHLDLFGATPVALRQIVGGNGLSYLETLEPPPANGLERCVLVFARLP